MRKPPASGMVSTTVTVLSVSPMEEDHTSLSSIFERSERTLCSESKWTLRPCATVESANRRVMSGQNPTRRYGAGPRAGFLAGYTGEHFASSRSSRPDRHFPPCG